MELRPADITQDVCQRCAACCIAVLNVDGDLRNLEFLEKVFGARLEVTWRGLCGCGCGSVKYRGQIKESCPALEESEGKFRCRDYESRPGFCSEFNCATWALVAGHRETELTKRAAKALFETRTTGRQVSGPEASVAIAERNATPAQGR